MLPVNDVFETIQGEATYTGMPSVFVRLQGCPVGCPWCDTKHTWELNESDRTAPETVFQKGTASPAWAELSPDDLVAELQSRYRARHIVITGGEPALHDLGPLTTLLFAAGYTVQVETSGTHWLECDPRTWITVSPKLNMPGGFGVRQDMLDRASEIKMPCGKAKDIEAAADIKRLATRPIDVWLQPLSMSPKATSLCVEACIEHGFRLSLQTHQYAGLK